MILDTVEGSAATRVSGRVEPLIRRAPRSYADEPPAEELRNAMPDQLALVATPFAVDDPSRVDLAVALDDAQLLRMGLAERDERDPGVVSL
jgi:hypothetical protein